jgi:hypothetical protein
MNRQTSYRRNKWHSLDSIRHDARRRMTFMFCENRGTRIGIQRLHVPRRVIQKEILVFQNTVRIQLLNKHIRIWIWAGKCKQKEKKQNLSQASQNFLLIYTQILVITESLCAGILCSLGVGCSKNVRRHLVKQVLRYSIYIEVIAHMQSRQGR